MSSVTRLLQQGCVGHVPEILDGDFPHHHRGCPAQAWGASEALRVWLKLVLIGFKGSRVIQGFEGGQQLSADSQLSSCFIATRG